MKTKFQERCGIIGGLMFALCVSIILAWVLSDCATTTRYTTPSCVPIALKIAASGAIDEGVPVRIVISHTGIKGVEHAEAQGQFGSTWLYGHDEGGIITWDEHSDNNRLEPKYRPLRPFLWMSFQDAVQMFDKLK